MQFIPDTIQKNQFTKEGCMSKFRSIILFIYLLSQTSLLFANSNEIVNNAWNHIVENNFIEAREILQSAIDDDNNPRAHIAISFIDQLLGKNKESWESYEEALDNLENPYPYIFAATLTGRGQITPFATEGEGMMTLYPDLISGKPADSGGILKTGAYERMGRYNQFSGDLQEAEKLFNKIGSINAWNVIGPFENISASGFGKVFGPEREYEFEKEYKGKNGMPANWFAVHKIRLDQWIDFTRYFAQKEAIYYGNTFVYSKKKQKVQIRVGTSGSVKVDRKSVV